MSENSNLRMRTAEAEFVPTAIFHPISPRELTPIKNILSPFLLEMVMEIALFLVRIAASIFVK